MGNRLRAGFTAGLLLGVAGIIGVGALLGAGREPIRMPNPQDVVAHVPSRKTDAREIHDLHRLIATVKHDPAPSLRLARLHMEEARRTSDPRHFGYAEAVLTPWCEGAQSIPDALVLRGMIHQSRHHFDVALVDLERALSIRPNDPQAWLVRASVLTVLGRYGEANKSCDAVALQATAFIAAACRAPIQGVQGRAQDAATRLHATLGQAQSASEKAWGASLLGELASFTGDVATAERRFREALAHDPDDRYSRGAYADLLLDSGRAPEAHALLRQARDDEGLLVRLAIAEQSVGAPTASQRRKQLRDQFDADRRRGEPVHAREETRFALVIEQQPALALKLALENWEVQREPMDAMLVLEAALAAGQPKAAQPVVAWVNETGFEGTKVRALSGRVEKSL